MLSSSGKRLDLKSEYFLGIKESDHSKAQSVQGQIGGLWACAHLRNDMFSYIDSETVFTLCFVSLVGNLAGGIELTGSF